MPVVPRRNLGNISTQPLPGVTGAVNAPVEAFGGGQAADVVGAGTRGLLGQVQGILQKEVQTANEIFTINVERRASEEARRINSDVRRLKGKNALQASQQASSDFDKFSSGISTETANPAQELSLKGILSRQKNLLGASVETYSSREIDKYQRQEIEASQINKGNEALDVVDETIDLVNSPLFPPDIELNEILKSGIDEKTKDYKILIGMDADKRGLGKEARKAFLLGKMTAYHAAVIKKLNESNLGKEAKQYLEDNKKEIDSETEEKLERTTRKSTLRGNSQDNVDSYIADELTEKEALAKARDIVDPEERDQTVARVKARYSEREAFEGQAKDDSFRDLWNKLEEAGGDIDKLSPDEIDALDPNQQKALETRSRDLAQGIEPVTDWAALTGFLSQPAEQVAQLTGADILVTYRNKMSDRHYQQILSRWDHAKGAVATARTKAEKDKQKVGKQVFSLDQEINRFMISQKMITIGKKTKGDKAKKNFEFEDRVRNSVQEAIDQNNGKAIGGEAVRKIILEVNEDLRLTPVQGSSADNIIELIVINPGDLDTAYIPFEHIPPSNAKTLERDIIRGHRAEGVSISGASLRRKIERMYAMEVVDTPASAEMRDLIAVGKTKAESGSVLDVLPFLNPTTTGVAIGKKLAE